MSKKKISPLSADKLSPLNWFNVCLFCLIGGIAWNLENMYFNTFLYNEIYATATKEAVLGTMEPSTAVSRMVALSAITAVITTFIIGTFSDRIKNRKVFISIGSSFGAALPPPLALSPKRTFQLSLVYQTPHKSLPAQYGQLSLWIWL